MTQKTVFNLFFYLAWSAIAPSFLLSQGVVVGKIVTKQGSGVNGMYIYVSGITGINRKETGESGSFEFKDEKLKPGTNVTLRFKYDSDYILGSGDGYTLAGDNLASGVEVKAAGYPKEVKFKVFSKAKGREETKKAAELNNVVLNRKAQEYDKKGDAESRQKASYLKQNQKSIEETAERVNLANYSEDNAAKSKAYQDAYGAVYNKGDMDAAFKILSDTYIDATLNAAKDKYRTAGTDETKKKSAKEELDKAVSDCVLKARFCVIVLEYDKAVDYYRKAVYADPDEVILRNEFADFLNLIGKGYKDTYEFTKARRAFQEAVDIREKLVKEDGGNEEYQYFKLLETQNNLISLFSEFNQMNEALEVYADADGTIKKYLDFVQRNLEKPSPAAKPRTPREREEAEKREKQARYKNSEDENLLVLAQLYSNLGSVSTLRKDYLTAYTYFDNALRIFEELLGRDVIKKNQLYFEFAETWTNVGVLYTDWYKSKEQLTWEEVPIDAPICFERSNQYYDLVKGESPSLVKAGKAHNYHQWARMYQRLVEKNENNKTYAENYFKKVDQVYEALSVENPKMFAPRRVKVLCDMFDFYITIKNVDKANLTIFKKLDSFYKENSTNINLEAFSPELADLNNHMGWIYHNFAKEKNPLDLDTTYMNKAQVWFEQSKTEYERLDRTNDNIFLPQKAYCYINLSFYYYSLHYAEPLNETKQIGLEYANKAIADLGKYAVYCKQFNKAPYVFRDFEADQYMKYAKEIKTAFEKFSITKRTLPKITTYNIYYPR